MPDQSGREYSTMIRDLPQGERPRERLRALGAGSLSNAELIAILLRTGVEGESVLSLSTGLLARMNGLPGMARVTYGELCAEKGISEAKASQLLAAFELGRRLVSMSPEDRAVVRSPQDVVNLLAAEMGYLDQEHLRVLLLSTRGEVVGIHEVYKGNVNASVVRVAEVVRPAIRENCPSIIVVHNHPSGDPSPSPEDVLVTRKIASGAEMLDIELLDHIVIGGQSHVSLKEKGLGFGKAVCEAPQGIGREKDRRCVVPRGNEPLGDIASVVLFENERVKIWNLIVEPGETSTWHLHERDYVTVVVEGGGLSVEYDDGTTQIGSTHVGHWTFHDEHQPHRVTNSTSVRYKNVLIELKS